MKYIKRSDYWEYFMQQDDAYKIFRPNHTDKEQVYLFNKYVNYVNIEISAFCNRKCSYCPMSTLDRKQAVMDHGLFTKIINELSIMNYEGSFGFNLYNEPLLCPNFVDYVKEAKKVLPNTIMKIDTNGDYLTKELLEELAYAGMNEMYISRHPDNKDKGHYSVQEREAAIL